MNIALSTAPSSCHFLADGDNLLNRGFRRQARLRMAQFARACSDAGAASKTIVRNFFKIEEARAWDVYGFEKVAVEDNCDPVVVRRALAAIRAGVVRLIIASGDAGVVLPIASAAADACVQVEVWSAYDACSQQLDGLNVRFIDEFLVEPPPRRVPPIRGFRAPQFGLA
ncbi:hypothetical protein [Vitreimonas sp.]|uniref:hypothetical protein n=1 Tax=Vitreimonas sp. TaxID=3069702 RepID=UPI002EDA1616